MHRNGYSYLHQVLQILRYGLIGAIALAVIVCICVVFFILGVLVLGTYQQHQAFQQQLADAIQIDHQQFPQLQQPVLIFYRNHSPMTGNVVLVYAIDNRVREAIQQKALRDASQNDAMVECVKPAIKKRWRGWRKTLHYVQPNPIYSNHHDYMNHDSYFVQGSTEYLSQAVNACYMSFTRIPAATLPEKYPNFQHRYWALSDTENLLFSVYQTWH